MARVRDQQRICPHHGEMKPVKTPYGLRWTCMAAGCTVASWANGTSTPADAETRKLRMECHNLFDPCWRRGSMFSRPDRGGRLNRRSTAYEWLAAKMGLPINRTHFGYFTAEQCKKALGYIRDRINEHNAEYNPVVEQDIP